MFFCSHFLSFSAFCTNCEKTVSNSYRWKKPKFTMDTVNYILFKNPLVTYSWSAMKYAAVSVLVILNKPKLSFFQSFFKFCTGNFRSVLHLLCLCSPHETPGAHEGFWEAIELSIGGFYHQEELLYNLIKSNFSGAFFHTSRCYVYDI